MDRRGPGKSEPHWDHPAPSHTTVPHSATLGLEAARMPRAPSGHSRGRSGQTHSTVQLAISLHSRMAGRKAWSPIGTTRPRPQHIRLPQHTSLVGAGRARVSRIRGPGTPTAQPRTYHKHQPSNRTQGIPADRPAPSGHLGQARSTGRLRSKAPGQRDTIPSWSKPRRQKFISVIPVISHGYDPCRRWCNQACTLLPPVKV